MRYPVLAALAGALCACSSGAPGSARLVLNDPYWDRVNVQIVITKNDDCSERGAGVVSSKDLVMR